MRRINHFLPVKVRLGLAVVGLLLIIGEAATARLMITEPFFTLIFQSYYLLVIGIILLSIGLLASEQALDRLFGGGKYQHGGSANPTPGMGEKKNSIFGEKDSLFTNSCGHKLNNHSGFTKCSQKGVLW